MIANYLRAGLKPPRGYRTKMPRQKTPWYLVDGPLHGETLLLESNASSAWFALKGVVGRYVCGRWVSL